MTDTLVIHPLNRGIRPIRVELAVEAGKIVGVKPGTTYFWDFTGTLKGKDPFDALQLTQRTSGLDFVAHAAAAARALEEIGRVRLSANTNLSRNILLALDMIYGHLNHFYQSVLPDYIPYPEGGPFNPVPGDFRISAGTRESMIKNMWRAFDLRQSIHTMFAILAGKAPHICSIVFAGTTVHLNVENLIRLDSYLKELAGFINNEYYNDVGQIETAYAQYFNIGAGNGNLLTTGEFPGSNSTEYVLPAGTNFSSGLNKSMISIDCTGAWFNAEESLAESLASSFIPAPDKKEGYSWTKSALYDRKPCETGALARMTLIGNTAVTGLGLRSMSVLGRYRARLEESRFLADKISGWLEAVDPADTKRESTELPEEGEAAGTAEASNGAVVHYLSIKNGRIDRYNVLDSLSWNLCPMTREGQTGPMAKALMELNAPALEVTPDILRVARSF